MTKATNLRLVGVLMLVTLTFMIGDFGNWFGYVGIVLLMYYFIFVVNLFRTIYDRENFLTKILFDFSKTPIYISGLIIIASVFLKKSYPDADYEMANLVAAAGVVVSAVAIIKRAHSVTTGS